MLNQIVQTQPQN